MSTKALFSHGGGSNLILGTGTVNQIFFQRTPAAIKFFHQILKNCHLGVKNKLLPIWMDFYSPYMVPYMILWGNYNFPRGTNKIQIFDKISTSGKKLSI